MSDAVREMYLLSHQKLVAYNDMTALNQLITSNDFKLLGIEEREFVLSQHQKKTTLHAELSKEINGLLTT